MQEELRIIDQMDHVVKAMENREGKYLTFSLAGEEYGIEISKVKEIIGIMPITAVPQTPHYVKGVINLRGKVINVVDLRSKFDMVSIEHTERSCIIVVDIADIGGSNFLTGVIVDSVSEVLNVKAGDIEETPNLGSSQDKNYIGGLAKTGDRITILLEIDRVLLEDQIVDKLRN